MKTKILVLVVILLSSVRVMKVEKPHVGCPAGWTEELVCRVIHGAPLCYQTCTKQ